MKKKFLISGGVGLLALLIVVPLAFAGGPRGGEGRGERGPRWEKMAERLGLDEKQKVTVKGLFEQHRDEAKSLREQLDAAREKVKAAWLDKNATEASVKAAHREVHALQGQLAEQRVEFGFALKRVLTPAQFEKVANKLMKGGGFGKGHHFKGKGGRGWGGRGDFGGRGGPPDAGDIEE
ncbi:MAG TPA: periplasmic heavy metal sensor [Myxococcota bacterium]|nr:periplasmic heavy metal sensor [Myxococcota bacterium]